MAGFAQQLVDLHAAPESFDPADLDGGFDDNTSARKGKKSTKAINLEHEGKSLRKAKLQMRANVPVLPEYGGKSVARKQVFGEAEVDSDDDNDEAEEGAGDFPFGDDLGDDSEGPAGEDAGAAAISLGNFSISSEMEKEYEKMMKKSQSELNLLRMPSAAEVAKKEAEAKQLKQQAAGWSALVEFRIHLEGALSIAHRLPAGDAFGAIHGSGEAAATKEMDAVAGDTRELLGTLLDLQHNLAQQRGLPTSSFDEALHRPKKRQRLTEADTWALVDSQMQPIMDWGLGLADEWKEKTRLDARRSFKVLDQSLSSQMRASEAEPEKLRRRCTPPSGRHQVFGVSSQPAASSGTEAGATTALEEEQDIFDDREFYVQLLREALSSGDKVAGSEESKELQMELQGRRASKKRNRAEVERRASKGRKIRYVAIEKLQNFMASRPRSDNSSTVDPLMGDGAADALLRSLFSSIKNF